MEKIYIKDEDFIQAWKELGSPTLVSKKFGMSPRVVMNKRNVLECLYNIKLETHNSQREQKKEKPKKIDLASHNVRRGIDVDKVKRVIVFSDAHFTD